MFILKNTHFIGVAPITHLRTCVIEIVTFKRGHLMWQMLFSILLNERIRSPLERIVSFKRSSHFEKGPN